MFCRIYVTAESINPKSLLTDVCGLLNAELIRNAYIEKDGYSIEVRPNDDYDEKMGKVFPDGFLYFPFSIEIDIEEKVAIASAAEQVGIILEYLWKKNFVAIASCQFEELLPEGGGYMSKNVPWVK